MSSQGFQGGGGSSDDKPRPTLQQTHILQQSPALSATMVKQARIAPAPTMVSQLVPPHNLITRLPVLTGEQQAAVSSQASVVLPGMSTTTLAATLQTIPTAINIQTTGTSLIQAPAPAQSAPAHQTAFRPARTSPPVLLTMPMPMSSLIRAAGPAGGSGQTAGSTQLGQPPVAVVTSTVSHAAPQPIHAMSHVPRGAAAASALATPKSTAMAQVLRPHQPQNITTTGVTLSAAAPLLAARGILPLRSGHPGTQPGTQPRSSSPSAAALHVHPDSSHRPVLSQQAVTTGGSSSAVQITIQQKTQSEATPRQVMPVNLQAAMNKPVQLTQGTHQVVVSQTAGSITPLQQHTTMQKTAGQTGYLPQGVPRPQRMVVAQPAAAVHSANTNKQGNQVSRQKVMMPQSSGIAGKLGSGMVQQAIVTTGLSLPQSLAMGRSQKVVVTQMQAGMNPNTPMTVLAKTVAPTQSAANTTHATIAMANTVTSAVSSIPIAKVPPQRQMLHSPGQQTLSTAQQVAPMVAQQLTSVIHDLSTNVTTTTQTISQASPGMAATGVLLPTGHRQSPVTLATTANITTAVTLAATASDTRQDNRSNLPTFQSAYVPSYYPGQPTIVNYQAANLMYQQVATAQNLSFQNTASLRPGIVPSNTPNLAATLQAHGVTVAPTQGVRVNPPLMVTVDTSRQLPHTQYALQPDSKITAAATSETTVTTSATAFTNALNQSGVSSTVSTQPSPLINNQSASPRPSILRKRTSEGVAVRKNLLTSGSLDSASPNDQSSVLSTPTKMNIHDPARENSQSSTDTASSSESGPHSVTTPELKIKEEPPDSMENGPSHSLQVPSSPALSTEASPRKKPRKQLLNAAEELKDGMSSEEEDKISSKHNINKVIENMTCRIKKEAEEEEASEFIDEEGVRWTVRKERPGISLMNHYSCSWKPRNNHFLRYQDVKPKEERRPTVNELANQKGIQQKASGWRLYHLAAQLEEIMDIEKDVCSKMLDCQNEIAPKHIAKHTIEDDIGMVHEITQGNMQRCRLVIDQLAEAKSSMIKILEHKTRINEIINKHHSKRPVKKKERS